MWTSRLFTSLLKGQFKSRADLPKDRALIACGIVSLGAFVAATVMSLQVNQQGQRANVEAARIMERTITAVREHWISQRMQFDDAIDPNHTGLIGPELTEITTTVGNLEAKRTTTNPNIAGVVVQLLQEAGVSSGDTVAVGCSGSFPALMVATLAACEALNVHPIVILSLGASSYGATRMDFTLLDIAELLRGTGLFKDFPVAVSLGGGHDVGDDFEDGVKRVLIEEIKHSTYPFIEESNLSLNVGKRLAVYLGPTGNRKVQAFVNIGGNYVDLGTSPLVLKLEAGLNRQIAIPKEKETHGVVFAMAERHIPIIHLLHIKGLALKHGLAWDPIPLPEPSASVAVQGRSSLHGGVGVIASVYVVLLVWIFFRHREAFFRTLH